MWKSLVIRKVANVFEELQKAQCICRAGSEEEIRLVITQGHVHHGDVYPKGNEKQ